MGASYKMGSRLECLFHWPNGDQPMSMTANHPEYMALETTGCACGKGYCCIDMSASNKYLAITIGSSYCYSFCLVTFLLDYCEPNPCQNGGTCSNTGSGFTCECMSNWFGTRCQNTGEFSI